MAGCNDGSWSVESCERQILYLDQPQQCTTNCQHRLQQSGRKGGQGEGWYGRQGLSMFPTKTIVIAEHYEGSEAGCEFTINEK